MRRWVAGSCLFGALCIASPAPAQSISIDAPKEAPPAEPPPQPRARPPEPVSPPTPISTPVEYPEGGQGEQGVTLELTLADDGTVTQAVAVQGDPVFARHAVEAARHWKFHPARRGEKPIGAKIRYLVRFVPPAPEMEPAPSTSAAPSPPAPEAPAPVPRAAEPQVYEVVVRGQREPVRHRLSRAEISQLPGAFGDPFRAIDILPGVVPLVSGLPYFYVRGAPPGNVGYFFDGVPVPFLYHFAAGPGVLHPAFVEHVDLYPGAYPARYGRVAGAIVAGDMAAPSYRWRGEASIRLIDSGAMLEAPLPQGRGSVMLGGRYSYTGLVLSLIVPQITLNYWDYQARARYALDRNNSVEILAFGSGDFLSNRETVTESRMEPDASGAPRITETVRKRERTLVDVAFHRVDLRWDHRIRHGNWRNAVMFGLDRTRFDEASVIVTNRLVGARSEFEHRPGEGVELRAGADVLFERLSQKFQNQDVLGYSSAPDGTRSEPDFGFNRARSDVTTGGYAEIALDVTRDVQITPGIRLDVFVSGTRAAVGVDPRISTRYQLSRRWKMVHGLALVHQAPSFVVPVPGLKPSLAGGLQTALQHSAGVSCALPASLEASVTLFQNAFLNMTDYISLVQLENASDRRVTDMRTMGHAYGAEFMLRRSLTKDLGGFVSYTLSRSLRSTRRLQGPATTDRTHVLNVAASYNLGKNWRFGARWLLYSGIPVQVAYLEAAKHPPRTPPFWRLDFKLQKRWYIAPPHVWWGLALEVLNTTLHKEALSGSCNAFRCTYETIGPVTVPSLGAEGAF